MVLLLTGSLGLTSLPLLFGVALAVLGAGLVVGAFLHAGRGLIPFALILAALTWTVLAAPLGRWSGDGFGDLTMRPSTAAQLQPEYRRAAGDMTLDLRGLDLTATPGSNSPLYTAVSTGVGDVDLLIPPNADVRFTGSTGVGDVRFEGQEMSGPGAHLSAEDVGADGTSSGRLLVLDVHTGAGDVEVQRD